MTASVRRLPMFRIFITGFILIAAVLPQAAGAASRPAATGTAGMVVGPEPRATQVGLTILKQGGNVVDASIAVSFTLAVTLPRAGNLGGGGFLLYRDSEGRFFALDHRETAPSGLNPELFLDDSGKLVPERSLGTGLAVGVPGSVAGLLDAHRRWGRLPWSDLVEPARLLAAKGFEISPGLASSLNAKADLLSRQDAAARIFTRSDRPWRAGDRLVQKDLAATLGKIATGQAESFYGGTVAAAIVASVRNSGGVMTREDLAAYAPVLRKPIQGDYKQFRVTSFPPPSSGGVVLLQLLKMLEPFNIAASGYGGSRTVHLMVEAERRSYADRAEWMGDPDYFDVPVKSMLDDDYIKERRRSIDPARATRSSQIGPMQAPQPEPLQTAHFSVADGKGAIVSMTTTLNSSYGSGIVAAGTGILLNNEIDDFAVAPGVPNQYGLIGGQANAIEGGKRPLSSMTPTIVEDRSAGNRPVLALGSPGGSTIITTVLQVLLNVLEHRMPLQDAVDAPRFHHQWLPDDVKYEPYAFPQDVLQALKKKGHDMAIWNRPLGNVAAIYLDKDGVLHGAADSRGYGSAEGY